MNSQSDKKQRLNQLVLFSLEEIITPAEARELDNLLRNDADLRQYYLDYIVLHVNIRKTINVFVQGEGTNADGQQVFREVIEKDLQDSAIRRALIEAEADEKLLASSGISAAGPMSRPRSKPTRAQVVSVIAKMAAVLLVAVSIVWLDRFVWRHVAQRNVTSSGALAHLTSSLDAVWSEESGCPSPESLLFNQSFSLLGGFAELTFLDGTTVICEGPSQFSLEGAKQMYLCHGEITVRVPKGSRHFTVRSPFASVIDYGTEFGLAVDDSGNAETHVYEGQVELRSGPDPLVFGENMRLKAGQAGRADTKGTLAARQFDAYRFVRTEEYRARRKSAEGSAYDRWLANSYEIRRNPDLAAYYTFERNASDPSRVTNLSQGTGVRLDGFLESDKGALGRPAPGRWPGQDALHFDRGRKQRVRFAPEDRLCISGPITIAAWIKCGAGDRGGHIISCRQGFQVNYQFSWFGPGRTENTRETNCLQFIRDDEYARGGIYSKPAELAAGWNFVAVTHDNHTINFYVNGELWDTKPHDFYAEPVVCETTVGDLPDEALAKRWPKRFDGDIDELLIFKRTFTAAEMKELYRKTSF